MILGRGSSDFDHVAVSATAFINLHGGALNRPDGEFTIFSEMMVINRDSGDAEARDPGHLALLHDLYVYDASAGRWNRSFTSGWRYGQWRHNCMQLALSWAAPPNGAGQWYCNVAWAGQYEVGAEDVWYVGSVVGGSMYAVHSPRAAVADENHLARPEPPSAPFIAEHQPVLPDFERDVQAGKHVHEGVGHRQAD